MANIYETDSGFEICFYCARALEAGKLVLPVDLMGVVTYDHEIIDKYAPIDPVPCNSCGRSVQRGVDIASVHPVPSGWAFAG